MHQLKLDNQLKIGVEHEKFVLNKGKLPWPVLRGVVIQKFGTQPHPVVKTAKIKSNGIVIATPKFEKVKTKLKYKYIYV